MRHVDHKTNMIAPVFHEVAVIAGSARRRRWSSEEKARIVAESLDPVVSVSAVARKHVINPDQLFTLASAGPGPGGTVAGGGAGRAACQRPPIDPMR